MDAAAGARCPAFGPLALDALTRRRPYPQHRTTRPSVGISALRYPHPRALDTRISPQASQIAPVGYPSGGQKYKNQGTNPIWPPCRAHRSTQHTSHAKPARPPRRPSATLYPPSGYPEPPYLRASPPCTLLRQAVPAAHRTAASCLQDRIRRVPDCGGHPAQRVWSATLQAAASANQEGVTSRQSWPSSPACTLLRQPAPAAHGNAAPQRPDRGCPSLPSGYPRTGRQSQARGTPEPPDPGAYLVLAAVPR